MNNNFKLTKHNSDDDIVAFTVIGMGVITNLDIIKSLYAQGFRLRPFIRKEAKVMATLDLGFKWRILTETDVTFEIDEDIFND